MIPSYEYQDLFGIKMIVLMEQKPQSDHYHQVMLTQEQFKKVSDVLSECFIKTTQDDDTEMVKMVIGGDCVFYKAESYYDEKELEEKDSTED